MKTLKVKIVSQTSKKEIPRVKQVTLPTPDGYITILPGHDKLISVLSAGTIRVVQESGQIIEEKTIGGIVQINNNTVKILLD